MPEALFCSLTSDGIASQIRAAQISVCYAAPGIQAEPAMAMAEVAARLGPELITACLDFDERALRMGFGDITAVKVLREAGIAVSSAPGLRTGLLIVDREGYIFTPTALYLESDDRPTDAPNAMRLSKDQVSEALARLSPAANAIAIILAKTEEERDRIKEQVIEIRPEAVTDEAFRRVEQRLTDAPPARFDVARQVNVFSAYLQYVELSLTGAAIQRLRVAIPPNIQKLGGATDIEGRLRTTFDLIAKDERLSSKVLDEKLNEIRKNFTPSLGRNHGRVVLKSAKPRLEQRLDELRKEVICHQERVENELQLKIDNSRDKIIDYYVQRVLQDPPDAMLGSYSIIDDANARKWLGKELDRVLPKADSLIQKMQLEVRYKDLTFETLSRDDFLGEIKAAFPDLEWDRTHDEFIAAGESAPPSAA